MRQYYCSKCKAQHDKSVLTVKRVAFLEMGLRGRTLKSRVVEYLCPGCLVLDQYWNLPKISNPFEGIATFNEVESEQ